MSNVTKKQNHANPSINKINTDIETEKQSKKTAKIQ